MVARRRRGHPPRHRHQSETHTDATQAIRLGPARVRPLARRQRVARRGRTRRRVRHLQRYGTGAATYVVWADDFDRRRRDLSVHGSWLFTTGTSYPGGAPQFGTGEVQTYTDDPANVQPRRRGAPRHHRDPRRRAAGGDRRGSRPAAPTSSPPPAGRSRWRPGSRSPPPARATGRRSGCSARASVATTSTGPGSARSTSWRTSGGEPSHVYGTLHCGVAPGGPCREFDGISGRYPMPDGKPLSADFHTFSIQWDRSLPQEEIRWYVDGQHSTRCAPVTSTPPPGTRPPTTASSCC